jgi:cell division protein FtsW (lipid II flippase)
MRYRRAIGNRSVTRTLLMLLAPLPALLVGVLLMRHTDVSAAIWGQQLGAGTILLIVCGVASVAARNPSRSRAWPGMLAGSGGLLLLLATLLHSGVDGVRRWVAAGPLQLHAAFIVLPVLIIILGGMLRRDALRNATWALPIALGVVAGVLVLQPDASQASAFATAVAIILVQRTPAHWGHWVAIGIVSVAAVLAFTRPDPLDAVPHVEGIVGLAVNAGAPWLIAAVFSLLLLPMPFVVFALTHHDRRRESLALAVYYIVLCMASLVAPFPVPVLGFGLSPIMGYFAALGWVMRSDRQAERDD